MKIWIDPRLSYRGIIRYTLQLAAFNRQVEFRFVTERTDAELLVSEEPDSDLFLHGTFYRSLLKGDFNHKHHFPSSSIIHDETGRIDHLATIYYCSNSLQERADGVSDPLGRFKYESSYQARFDNVFLNLVQDTIDDLFRTHPKLSRMTVKDRPTRIFLTHDIDTVYGAWKEDGMRALRYGRIDKLFRLVVNILFRRPDWLNMDKIILLEEAAGVRSVFYWLLYKDRVNADYDFRSRELQAMYQYVKHKGWESGIHKSMHGHPFSVELKRMPDEVRSNRYHFLRFKVPAAYRELEQTGLQMDTSLGFTEQWGFRNSYGLPFMPYDQEGDRVFRVLEVPLHVMDRTFYRDQVHASQASGMVIDWMEQNRKNCVFTFNFHNNFFYSFKYYGYTRFYTGLLKWMKESNVGCITEAELIREFHRPELFS
jgi:hypothetical protein